MPQAREKKEQPAPTSKPGGGDAKQCGTPWHPSAAASEAAAAIAVSTPLGGMERAKKRDGRGDPGRRCTREQPWPHRPRAAASSPRGRGGSWWRGRGAVVGGRPELGPPLSQVPAWPCHSRLPEKRRKGARLERLDGGGHAGSRRLCALGAAGAEGAAAAGPGPSPCARPGGRSRTHPSGLPPRPLLLLRLRLPLLKEDSAQPNSSLIIPAQISLRRKHSLSSRTHSAPLALTRCDRTAISVAFRYPEPQV